MVALALLALALGTLGAIPEIPQPWLDSSDTAVAGANFTVNCSLPPNTSRDILLRLVAQNRLGWPLNGTCQNDTLYKHPKDCEYQVPEDEEGALTVSCKAELQPYSSQVEWKEIRVDAKPRLDPGSCPAQQNWTEGETQTLECGARGRPDPDLECSKDGISIPVKTPIPAERIHAGIYLCRAWNYLGSVERNVTVWVQYSAPFPLLAVLLGILLPVLALLVLTGLYWWHHYSTKVGKYRLWKRPPGHQGATNATKATKGVP